LATNKIRGVVLVSFEYPPRRLSTISDLVFKIASFLNKNNIKVWVITFDDWRNDIEIKKKNFTIHRIPNNVHNNISFFSTIMNLKSAYQSTLASILHKEQIDIIHFFDWQVLPLLIPWGDKLTQKLIYTAASIQKNRDTSIPTNEGIKKVEQISLKVFDLIIADSKKLTNQIVENYSINEQKIITCSLKQKKYASEVLELYSKLNVTK
jgi:glycosyltransferase involved in cell wall biosynthesis